ncbi:MAG: hypothetical protein QOH45_1625, partial [Pseudonocardiales bacterium]|nr:hypothetical protein [Pseudonocardiales bacterium]
MTVTAGTAASAATQPNGHRSAERIGRTDAGPRPLPLLGTQRSVA